MSKPTIEPAITAIFVNLFVALTFNISPSPLILFPSGVSLIVSSSSLKSYKQVLWNCMHKNLYIFCVYLLLLYVCFYINLNFLSLFSIAVNLPFRLELCLNIYMFVCYVHISLL